MNQTDLPTRPNHDDPDARTDGVRAHAGLRRGLLWIERGFGVVGVVCLALFFAACAERSFFQSWHAERFDRELEHVLTTDSHDQSEWTPERKRRFETLRDDTARQFETLGRLEIPRAGVSVMVLEGTDEDVLDRAVGRIEGTARPGERGNIGVAGHRDSFFRGLRHLDTGDVITLASREGLARYEIAEISIVEPRDVEVLEPTDEAALTLVTCYPFYYVGSAPKRYIVRAYQVGFDAWSREVLDRYETRTAVLAQRD